MPSETPVRESVLNYRLKKGDGPRLAAWRAAVETSRTSGPGAQDALDRIARDCELSALDRGLAYEILQTLWRRRRALDAALASLADFQMGETEPALAELLRIGICQILELDRVPEHAAVSETVEAASRVLGRPQAGFVNAALRAVVRAFPDRESALDGLIADAPLETKYSFPGWCVRLTKRAVGLDRAEAALAAMNRPMPLRLRARMQPALLAETLAKESLDVSVRTDLAPGCVECASPAGELVAGASFQGGDAIVQDASAQLVGEFAGAAPGMTVIDFCAAPGGKTTHLADTMLLQGCLVAADVSKQRLFRVAENVTRLGQADFVRIRHLRGDGEPRGEDNAPSARDEDIQILREMTCGGADLVLVDAPCSGLGTLRRHPEIRWRVRNADLKRLATMQRRVLARAAQLVKPGGRLVYATCSLAPEENEEVVAAFLADEGRGFETQDLRDPAWSSALSQRVDKTGWLHTWPDTDDMDSVGAVRLRRRS